MGTPALSRTSDSSTNSSAQYSYVTGDRFSKTAAELQYRSRCFVDALNGRAFRRFIQLVGPEHISKDFTAYLDNQSLAFSWPEFVAVLRNAAKADPEYHVNIVNQSVDLDERSGHAMVFMLVEIVGRPAGVRREDALIFEWKRERGRWMCYGHTAIRGSSTIRLADHG